MKYLILLVIFPFGLLNAQKKMLSFTFSPSGQKITGSLYNAIEFRDLRDDTTSLGLVQVGAVNTKARVVPDQPLKQQFDTLLASLVGDDAKQGKLLLTFRRFSFIEQSAGMEETGFFFVRADLYENVRGEYNWINTVDTIVQFNAVDVTQKLLRKGENIITDFISRNLTSSSSSERSFSLYETTKLDSIQKSGLALYTRKELMPGLYETYESFRDQKPTRTDFQTIESSKKVVNVFLPINSTSGLQEIKPDDYFAVIHKGVAYVATKDGYFPLEKRGDDFYYGGAVKIFTVGPALIHGMIGIAFMTGKTKQSRFKLDHINGSFLYQGLAKKN
jgi:hypothetical protein